MQISLIIVLVVVSVVLTWYATKQKLNAAEVHKAASETEKHSDRLNKVVKSLGKELDHVHEKFIDLAHKHNDLDAIVDLLNFLLQEPDSKKTLPD